MYKPASVRPELGGEPECKVIMRNGALLPGMAMPLLGPPPADPHPSKRVEEMRLQWDLRVIDWDGVWPVGRKDSLIVRRGGQQCGALAPN